MKAGLFSFLLVCFAASVTITPFIARADGSKRIVPSLAEPAQTGDSTHMVEGTAVAPAWSWRARLAARYLYGPGLADRASQLRGDLSVGLGFPASLEAILSLPMAWTLSTVQTDPKSSQKVPVEGMGDFGFGVGDLSATVLWSLADSSQGGWGFLLGVSGYAPTGANDLLLGEGGVAAEPLVSAAFQVLGSRLSLNLAYRIRPEHRVTIDGEQFEQDDELIWRAGLRIPKKYDLVWSVEAQGAVGMATDEGIWPGSGSRPLCIGGGMDFPVGRLYRLGITLMVGVAGEAGPRVLGGLVFSQQPVLSDEDGDGVSGASDACPLLKEDPDGFEDGDGCPDLDNDQDGFPDDEDACPTEAGDDFSEDGC